MGDGYGSGPIEGLRDLWLTMYRLMSFVNTLASKPWWENDLVVFRLLEQIWCQLMGSKDRPTTRPRDGQWAIYH